MARRGHYGFACTKQFPRGLSTTFPGSCSISWLPSFTVSWVRPEVKAGQTACSRCTLLRCEEEAKIETASGTASCLGCDPGSQGRANGVFPLYSFKMRGGGKD